MTGERLRVGVPLSLSGTFARFGRQARLGLEVWRYLDGTADLVVEDDRSDADALEAALLRLSQSCDLLLGPYSTRLTRRATNVTAAGDRLLWNHGGSGDDVERARPGHVVSVLTPASRYAEPFVRHVADAVNHLWIAYGKGSFGRQAAAGAEALAVSLGLPRTLLGPGEPLPSQPAEPWALFCAGAFEEDVRVVAAAKAMSTAPLALCAVAAGVQEFGAALGDPEGVYGVGQWAPGTGQEAELGISERDFLRAYRERAGSPPDYPAVQAVAAAVIATHCATTAGGVERAALWRAASALRTTTLFGGFGIDPRTGAQLTHRTVLTRWASGHNKKGPELGPFCYGGGGGI
jgi:ABC-type branched-subunit amino acid transport system substrate-binding protein